MGDNAASVFCIRGTWNRNGPRRGKIEFGAVMHPKHSTSRTPSGTGRK